MTSRDRVPGEHRLRSQVRVLWVTGAGKELGRAIATALTAASATVAVTARTEADLRALGTELGPHGRTVHAYPGSVSDPATVRRIARAIRDEHGGLDGLVNCAGVSPSFERSETVDDETWNGASSRSTSSARSSAAGRPARSCRSRGRAAS